MAKKDDISDVMLFVLYDYQLQEMLDRITDARKDLRFESGPWPFDSELAEAAEHKLNALIAARDEGRAR